MTYRSLPPSRSPPPNAWRFRHRQRLPTHNVCSTTPDTKQPRARHWPSGASGPQDLANDELRSSALLFQLKALLDTPGRKDVRKAEALKACATCPGLIAAFFADIKHGQALARTALQTTPGDEAALFFLGKLDLNYVWLQLGPMGRKTGWDEYWEARRSLDGLLAANPRHVRGRVARAWIRLHRRHQDAVGHALDSRAAAVASAPSRRSPTPRASSRTSSVMPKPSSRCGTCASVNVTWARPWKLRCGSRVISRRTPKSRPSWAVAG